VVAHLRQLAKSNRAWFRLATPWWATFNPDIDALESLRPP
jgi:hypothetical protein